MRSMWDYHSMNATQFVECGAPNEALPLIGTPSECGTITEILPSMIGTP